MDRSKNELALAAAFGLVLFVTVLTAAVVLGQSSSDDEGVSGQHHCDDAPFDDPIWEDPDENCGHATATPAPPTATPCNRDPLTLECLPPSKPDTATPVPDTATPVPDTATAVPDTPTAEPTATEPPPPPPPPPPIPDTPTPTATATATPTPIPPLGAPASFSAAGSGTSITLTWGAAANADGYQIDENDAFSCGQGGAGGSGASGNGASGSEEGARGACDNWFHLAFKGAGDTSHTVTGLTHGLTYDYRIRSYRTLAGSTDYSGYSYAGTTVPTATPTAPPTATTPPTTPPTADPSATPTATPLPTPPAPSLTVTVPTPDNGVHSIDVSWDAIDGVTSYEIAYGPTSGSEQSKSIHQSTSLNVISGCGVTTYFKGRSHGNGTSYAAAWGDWSGSEDGTTGACTPQPVPSTATPTPTPLEAPTGLTGRAIGDGKIALDWDDASEADVTYEVQQKKGKSFWEKLQFWTSDWRKLPFDHFGIAVTGSEAVISSLVDGKSYEHRVRSVKGERSSDWSDSYETEMPAAIPHLGHQKDHIVQYEIGTMPTRDPSVPRSQDPSAVISAAISVAVAAWNDAVSTSWPNLLFCKDDSKPCTDRKSDLRAIEKDTDGFTTTINVVSGEVGTDMGSTRSLELASIPDEDIKRIIGFLPLPAVINVVLREFFDKHFGDDDCGDNTACVKPKGVLDIEPFVLFGLYKGESAPGQHMKNLEMVIEEPAWSYRNEQHKRRVWTLDRNEHGFPVRAGGTYTYLPSVVMHEFGHAAGLTDLYEFSGYGGYLMDDTHGFTTIPALDIAYVRQVYRNEHGTAPH